MKLIANRINGTHLRDLLPVLSAETQVDSVLAAVAYGSSASDITQDLVGHCVVNKLRLDLWMRYDHTVPVSVELLRRLIRHQQDNVFTCFVPDRFHPKVIWWKGYGAYIGSANHTDNGWLTNIEAGVFSRRMSWSPTAWITSWRTFSSICESWMWPSPFRRITSLKWSNSTP